jgi:Ca2+-transporting ATPase
LTDADRAQISQVNADLAGEAMRLLAVAWREFDTRPAGVTTDVLECDLLFGGLIAMIDPPREEAKEAVRKCSAAGIRTVMITGDHKNTAVAIGKALGLYRADSRALTGDDLQKMNEQELDRQVGAVAVYARVSPEHKLRIVRAWRKRGDVVAMTGDGVNDAPAVKEADIGVSMGITGTDVTKEVSDMVVTDDNFASIVAAVEEGRGIYDNILKFVHYLLSCNAGEILVMFLAALAGMPVPLLPIHILWVNLVTDGLPALALGVDPVSPGIMRRPPRDPAAPVVGLREGLVLVVQGLLMAVCTLTAFQWVRRCGSGDLEHARTAAFAVLALSQLFHAFNCRSRRESVFTVGVFSNRVLLAAVAVSAALQVLAIQTDGVHRLFRTVDLAAGEWGLVVLLASLPLWGMELVKFGVRLYTKRG